MIAVHTGASKFDDGVAQPFVGRQFEFSPTVEAYICGSHRACLQPIGSDDLAGVHMFDDQVITVAVELVRVVASCVRRFQSFA